MSENIHEIESKPLRAEEHGEVNQDRANYAVLLKKWSFVAVVLAIYQIVAASLHLANWGNGLHIAFIVESSITLVLIGALIRWLIVTTREHEARTDLSPEQSTSDIETTIYFVATLILSVFKVIITLNAHLFSSRTSAYLIAQSTDKSFWSANYGDANAVALGGTLDELRHWYMIINLVLTIYLLLAARGIFWFINNKKNSVSYVIYFSSLFVVTAALIAVGDINRVKNYDTYPQLAKFNPIGSLNRLSVVLIVTAAITLLIWITTFRRWRSGAFILSVILLALGVVLITSDGFIFRGARATEKYYLEDWFERMKIIHQDSVVAAGCPKKYTERGTQNAPFSTSEWENWDNAHVWSLLNEDCKSIVAAAYSNDYFEIANLGLVAAGFLVLVGAGFYYFWYVAKHELHTPNTIEYAFLGLLIVFAVCASLGVGVNDNGFIKEWTNETGGHV